MNSDISINWSGDEPEKKNARWHRLGEVQWFQSVASLLASRVESERDVKLGDLVSGYKLIFTFLARFNSKQFSNDSKTQMRLQMIINMPLLFNVNQFLFLPITLHSSFVRLTTTITLQFNLNSGGQSISRGAHIWRACLALHWRLSYE